MDNNRRSSDTPTRDQESNNFSSLFVDYSKGLNRSSTVLRDASKSFERSANKINVTGKSFSKDANSLLSYLREFSKDYKDINKEARDQFKENNEDLEDILDDNYKDLSQMYEKVYSRKSSSYTQTALKSLKSVFSFAIGQFVSASNRIIDNYNSQFTSITSRMQLSAGEYSSMLKDSTDWIRKGGLTKQFSQIDWTDQLATVLETGIRGDQAKQMAYQNMVTNKLLPMINTNTKTYTRMSKLLGDSFSESIQAIGTYTERVYGAEGLEEGRAEEVLASLERDLLLSNKFGDREQVSEMMSDYLNEYNKISNQISKDAADEYINVIKGLLEGDLNNLVAVNAARYANVNYADAESILEIGAQKWSEVIAKSYGDLARDTTTAAVLGKQNGLYNADVAKDYLIYNKYGSSISDTLVEEYDKDKELQRNQSKLQEGFYESITSQMDKWNLNAVSKVATDAAQFIPHTMEVLGMTYGIVKDFFIAWLSHAGSSSLTGSSASSAGGKVGSFIKGHIGPGSFGTVLRVASGAGALALAGVDAYKGYQSTGSLLEAGKSAIYGNYLSESDKLSSLDSAMSGQGRSVDLSNVLKNAGKGALAGTAIGGGLVGTAVGAAIGGAFNLIDQMVENAKYNKLAEASSKLQKSLSTLSETSYEYTEVVNRQDEIQKRINILNNEYYDSQGNLVEVTNDQKQSALEYLKENDLLSKSVKTLKDWDTDYSEIILKKIDREKSILALEDLSSVDDVIKNVSKYSESFSNIVSGDKYINPAVLKFAEAVGHEDSDIAKSPEKFDTLLREYAKTSGMSVEDFVNEANRLTSGGLVGSKTLQRGSDGYGHLFYNKKSFTYGDNFKQALEDYDLDTGFKKNLSKSEVANYQKLISDSFNSRSTSLEQGLSNLISLADSYIDESSGEFVGPKSVRDSIVSDYNSLVSQIKKYNKDYASQYGEDEARLYSIKSSDYDLSSFDALGLDHGGFRLGLSKVPYDDYAALLHKDEMVLTSAQAKRLRNTSDSMYRTIIDGASLRNVTSTPSSIELNSDSLVKSLSETIEIQTKTLVNSIDNIYEVVASILYEMRSQSRGYTRSVINYEGV